MSTDERTIKWYNENAEEYTKHVRDPKDSFYHSLYEKPAMYAELPDLKAKAVISLGCGSGEDSNYLKKRGARRSVGIDIAQNLINNAKTTYPNCEFELMDMEKLQFPDDSFDFAYSSFAIHYIEDWTKVFSEVYRVLKPGCSFLFSCGHPVSSAMEVSKDDNKERVRQLAVIKNKTTDSTTIVGDYMGRRKLSKIGNVFFMDVTSYHKSLGEISAEASNVGFLIQKLVEPMPQPEMKQLSAAEYEKLSKIPYVAIFKLLKPE